MSPPPSTSNVIQSSLSAELPPATLVSGSTSGLEDSSLYDIILDSEPGLQPLVGGATTFKSAITSFIDLLIEQEAPTQIWAKLPRGDWQLELERYCRQSTAAQMAYAFYSQQEYEKNLEKSDESLIPLQIGSASPGILELMSPDGVNLLADQHITPRVSIPLERGLMRGEYFILAVSPNFQGLILAKRVKNAPTTTQEVTEIFTMTGSEFPTTEPKPATGKSQLRILYSSRAAVISAVLDSVQRAVLRVPTNNLQVSLEGSHESEQASIRIEELIEHWPQLFALAKPDSAAQDASRPSLMDQLTMKQLQRQEELWRRVSSYRKQAEKAESLQLQNEELMNAIQLKDEFVNMVVQELRTPLTSMKTALSLLGSPSLKIPQRQRYIQLLNTECDRQNSLISGLLNLAQIEQVGETNMQALTLIDVVPGIVSTYQPLAQEKDIMLAYTIPDTLPTVASLVPWLRQVIVNLLHNSIKFTGKGGRVWVRAKQQGDYVQIDVQDTGVGISSSEIPKIFNRFYRVRSQGGEDDGGAGLGLTIVQQLLLRCGGSITVNSRLGQGSTFSVLLPVYHSEADSEEIE